MQLQQRTEDIQKDLTDFRKTYLKNTENNNKQYETTIKADINELKETLKDCTKAIKYNNKNVKGMSKTFEDCKLIIENKSYASVVAAHPRRQPLLQPALHSLLISSKNEEETGDEVINKINQVINTNKNDISIDKIRKAKDRRVIISCKNREDRRKVKEKIEEAKDKLTVTDMKNKNPLVIIKMF